MGGNRVDDMMGEWMVGKRRVGRKQLGKDVRGNYM